MTFFPAVDAEPTVELMPDAELRPIPSTWGHLAGFGANPPDNEHIDAALNELLAQRPRDRRSQAGSRRPHDRRSQAGRR